MSELQKATIYTAYYENDFGDKFSAFLTEDQKVIDKVDCQVVLASDYELLYQKLSSTLVEVQELDQQAVNQWLDSETTASESAPVPPGYQLVPVTPTPEMLKEIDLVTGFTERALTVRYSAMLAAAPKPTPIEVTDELLVDLYNHSAEDEWPAHLMNGEAVRRIVQRAFKHVGLEVKL
jgi:hypothetical protein